MQQNYYTNTFRFISSASVAATRDATSNGGQREAPVWCDSSRDAREQYRKVWHRQGVPLAGRGGGTAARGHPEDGRGQVRRPNRFPGRSLLPPRLRNGDQRRDRRWLRGYGPTKQQPRSAGAAAPEPGALAPAAGSPFTKVRAKEYCSPPPYVLWLPWYRYLNNLIIHICTGMSARLQTDLLWQSI